MENIVIFFSGGLSSFATSYLAKTNYPNANILLYFQDTLWEDEDLYRFIVQVSDRLELPLLTHSRGISPPQLMVKKKFLANNRVGICSKDLKMAVASDYLKKGIVPEIEKWRNKHFLKSEDFITDATLMFGIGVGELHRVDAIEENWAPFNVDFPLIEDSIDFDSLLAKYSLRRPRQYDQGFSHANCKSRCVKAGQAHFKNLLLKDEKTFFELMEQEIVISEYIRYTKQPSIKRGGKDYMFKDVYEFVSTGKKSPKIKHILETHQYTKNWSFGVDSKGNDVKKPYTFMKSMSLAELEKEPAQYDIFDWGGCSCFIDFENFSTENTEEQLELAL